MASKKVEFYEDAALEYAAAFDWYMERSPLAASKFAVALNRAMDMIVDAPQRWPTGSNALVDSFCKSFHLQLFIASFRAVIQVVAIAHTRRKPGYWKERV